MDVKATEEKPDIKEFLESLRARVGDTKACFVIEVNNNIPITIKKIFPNVKNPTMFGSCL